MTKKILLIARDYPRMGGGIAHYIARTFSHVSPGDLVVISQLEPGSSERQEDARFRVIHTGRYSTALRNGKLAILPLILSMLRHVLRSRGYGLVVAEQIQTAIPALIAARLLGAKLIIFAYGMEINTSRWRGLKGWMFRQADEVVTISSYSRALLLSLGVAPARIRITPPSVDAELCRSALETTKGVARTKLGIAEHGRVLLSVAVLRQQYKGIDTAIRAVGLLRPRYPEIRYFVIGDGPDRPRLEQIARDQELNGHVTFVGRVDDATKGLYYAACDLFMLPNRVEHCSGGERSEGFGIVFLEAALFGKPAVGGQGGSLDAVLHGETGLSVLGTSAEEVASAASQLLDDPELTERLSRAARRRAEAEFSSEKVTRTLYEESIREWCDTKECRSKPAVGASADE